MANGIGTISSFDFYFSVHESISSLIPILWCGVVCCVGGEGGNSNIATKTWKCFFLFFFLRFLAVFLSSVTVRLMCSSWYICVLFAFSAFIHVAVASPLAHHFVYGRYVRWLVCLFINCRFTHWSSVRCVCGPSCFSVDCIFRFAQNSKCVFGPLGYSDRQVLLTFSAVWEQTYVAFYDYLFALAPPTQL